MKKPVLLIALLSLAATSFAINVDSVIYQRQRDKINGMLQARLQKFSQYTESLDMHTGIFGLQTKKDIKRSNEILMDITRTDNAIFKELKILFDYKTFVQTQVAGKAQESESQISGYMSTINKLRAQLYVQQQQQAVAIIQEQHRQTIFIVTILLLMALSVFLLLRKR